MPPSEPWGGPGRAQEKAHSICPPGTESSAPWLSLNPQEAWVLLCGVQLCQAGSLDLTTVRRREASGRRRHNRGGPGRERISPELSLLTFASKEVYTLMLGVPGVADWRATGLSSYMEVNPLPSLLDFRSDLLQCKFYTLNSKFFSSIQRIFFNCFPCAHLRSRKFVSIISLNPPNNPGTIISPIST